MKKNIFVNWFAHNKSVIDFKSKSVRLEFDASGTGNVKEIIKYNNTGWVFCFCKDTC